MAQLGTRSSMIVRVLVVASGLACSDGEPLSGANDAGAAANGGGVSGQGATGGSKAVAGAGGAAGADDAAVNGNVQSGSAGRGGSDAGSTSAGMGGSESTNGQSNDCKPAAFPPNSVTCRRDADCAGIGFCLPEVPPPLNCGSPCPGCFMDRCAMDADCPNGVCERSSFTHRLECVPSCASAGCGAGLQCDTDGRCHPMSCADGFVCPAGRTCNASAMQVDANGCQVLRCDEAGGLACEHPAVCTSEDPRMETTGLGCAFVPCADPRHPGCNVNTRCRPELETSIMFGCARLECASDSDCDCGACIVTRGLLRATASITSACA